MKNTLLQPQVIAAIIGLLGLLVGVFISLLISGLQAKRELERLERMLKSNYEQKLIEERLGSYPLLWRELALLNKRTLKTAFGDNRLDEHIRLVLSELNGWYEKNGLTLSKNTYGRFNRLCSLLDSFLKASRFDNEADLKQVRQRVWELRQNLRADVRLETIVPNGDSDGGFGTQS